MNDLAAFVLAQVAEDEAAARQEDTDYANTTLLPTYDSDHQERWNTDRVLTECAAKRRIVERHEPYDRVYYDTVTQAMASEGQHCKCCLVAWPCPDLRDLASPYADHPDHREEWKP